MNAYLELEDKSRFYGNSFGAQTPVSGEVVFSTGMVGYPESLTDPSYKGQILALTYPLIGNYGVPPVKRDWFGLAEGFESEGIKVSGLVVSNYSENYSSYKACKSLKEWLIEQGIPAITGIDTRALTKRLREKGVMLGRIAINDEKTDIKDPNLRNLAAEVSVKEITVYNKGAAKKIVLVDCGAKNNMIRSLAERGVEVVRVPWDYDFLSEEYDGLVISNGPGDPKMCEQTIKNVRKAMENGKPIFGICLGNQILALAAGGNTYKLKYGHRSQNQPCIENTTKRCYITTQNHGFAVDMKTMPKEWEELFTNANDGTNEGLRHKTRPFFSVQYHPEHFPGPTDTEFLFDRFVRML